MASETQTTFCTIALLTLAGFVAHTHAQQLTVRVPAGELGTVQGYAALTSREGSPYWAFIGLPYADPASYTGPRRFAPSSIWTGPLAGDDEEDVYYANDTLSICPQRPRIELPLSKLQDFQAVARSIHKSKKQVRQAIREARTVREAKGKLMEQRAQMGVAAHWGREACLTLNINTKNIPEDPETEELHPVIVFFHGGGSDSWFGSVFTGQRLLEEKVVLITLNYRLGTLGAFNLGLDESPGNQAMYDAIVALEWIQKYVKYFGGDPGKVTITGQSAGAMMVTHLLLSPLAVDKGLFHGVWGFSGSALNVWATSVHPSLPHHLDVAFYAGCYDRETEPATPDQGRLQEIATCMKGVPIQTLVDALDFYEHQEESEGRLGYDARVPSIQSPSLTIPRFLSEDPFKILERWEQAPVPLVLGATRHDGSYPVEDILQNFLIPNGYHKNESFIRSEMIPLLMNMMGVADDSGAVYHSFASNYFGEAANSPKFNEKVPGMIDMSTVLGFKGGQYKMVEFQAKVAPEQSWFYSFDYKGRWTLYQVLNDFDMYIPGGISHTDDLFYYFFILPVWNDDMRVSKRVVRYFVNFATHGDPNGPPGAELPKGQVYWEHFDDMDHPFLVIDRKDHIEYDCPDSWIGAAEELGVPEDLPEEPSTPDPGTTTTTTTTTTEGPGTTTTTTTEGPPGTTTTTTTTERPPGQTTEDDGSNSGFRVHAAFSPAILLSTLLLVLVYHQ